MILMDPGQITLGFPSLHAYFIFTTDFLQPAGRVLLGHLIYSSSEDISGRIYLVLAGCRVR